jgi:hypothetical protein
MCQVKYENNTYPMRCPVDIEERQIKVHSGLSDVMVREGKLVEIKIGLIQNPETPLSVSTF